MIQNQIPNVLIVGFQYCNRNEEAGKRFVAKDAEPPGDAQITEYQKPYITVPVRNAAQSLILQETKHNGTAPEIVISNTGGIYRNERLCFKYYEI